MRRRRRLGRTADALVIFGITGDLAKKMTFDALYALERRGTLDVPVIGVAINDWDDEALRKHARESVEAAEEDEVDEKALERFAKRLSYVQGDYTEPETYRGREEGDREGEAPGLLPRDPALAVRGRGRTTSARPA